MIFHSLTALRFTATGFLQIAEQELSLPIGPSISYGEVKEIIEEAKVRKLRARDILQKHKIY